MVIVPSRILSALFPMSQPSEDAVEPGDLPRRPVPDSGGAGLPVREWRRQIRPLARLAAPTVQRLASAFVPDSADFPAVRSASLGVARKINLMPVHVSLGVLSLTCVFALAAGLRCRRRVACLPESDLRREIQRWSGSTLPMLSDVMLLYERLAMFQYYSRRETSVIDDRVA
jgi:hypothetical protein